MRRRSYAVLTALAAVLASACQSSRAPIALDVVRPFPAAYAGRVSSVEAEDLTAAEPAPAPARIAPPANGSVSFRATWLELPVEHARALLPGLAAAPPAAVESLPDGGTRSWSEHGVATSAPPRASSGPRVRNLGIAGGHVDPARLQAALAELDPACRTDAELVTVDVGRSAELATLDQRAFVRSARLVPAADSLLVGDVDVATFHHGRRLVLGAVAEGEALRIDVAWHESVPVLPIPTAAAPMMTFQVPALTRHRLTASTQVRGHDGFVVASLPGAAPGTVRLLCIEVEPGPTALAAR